MLISSTKNKRSLIDNSPINLTNSCQDKLPSTGARCSHYHPAQTEAFATLALLISSRIDLLISSTKNKRSLIDNSPINLTNSCQDKLPSTGARCSHYHPAQTEAFATLNTTNFLPNRLVNFIYQKQAIANR
ncbi:MAG: hypothetical protein F6K40_05990 [Okeania sp. SIO3I5]|uniref:hypothetical protein n=1 Tax=Okeania sp. SIO3I5 TaxID=2607805 RepID=UPI0013B6AA89|nr:hypothetical protein [Okeania sp. SIO3I5]NEQ35858.1 hypothetical protein [Okeania sp. SIO3I5]